MEGLEDQIFALFLLFCRIGGCLLFAPGFVQPARSRSGPAVCRDGPHCGSGTPAAGDTRML